MFFVPEVRTEEEAWWAVRCTADIEREVLDSVEGYHTGGLGILLF